MQIIINNFGRVMWILLDLYLLFEIVDANTLALVREIFIQLIIEIVK